MTTETTELVTEDQVAEIEAVNKTYRIDWRYPNHREHVDALIRDWRALKAENESLQSQIVGEEEYE